jgi:hypothetical protein
VQLEFHQTLILKCTIWHNITIIKRNLIQGGCKVLTLAWTTATTSGDRRLRALHRERGHHAMTGSVAAARVRVTGMRGEDRLEPLTGRPGPIINSG